MIAWLREQPLDLRELDRKVAAALRAERLAQLNALRRLASRGKGNAALAWIEDFLASDEPLVVFAGHREMQDRLVERFPDALHLLGRDSIERARGRRPGLPGRRVAAAGLRHARRRPGHHADARVQRRLPRPRVDAGDARPGRGPLPPHRPARRRHGLVPARREDDRRDDARADRAQAARRRRGHRRARATATRPSRGRHPLAARQAGCGTCARSAELRHREQLRALAPRRRSRRRASAAPARRAARSAAFVTAQFRYHLRSAGTTYQGATSVLQRSIASP